MPRPVRVPAWRPAAAIVLGLGGSPAMAGQDAPRLSFADLPGWPDDDHAAALGAFRKTCRHVTAGPACRAAARLRGLPRLFFERWFEPVEAPRPGFLTGYYEPELPGSREPDATFRMPLLAPPPNHVARPDGPAPAGWPEGRTAARRSAAGYEPYPDRGAIEDGALGPAAAPLAFLADPVDAFIVHVQGSALLRLRDGGTVRVGFAGRNGHPYTSIGRVLAEAEGVPPAAMTADRLWAWLKAHPDRAPAIMRANRSFIFFRTAAAVPGEGPTGAAGVPLTAGRSLAVDRSFTTDGTPVWLDGELPRPAGGAEPLRRLVVAQDTGAAIVGPARGDLFFGSGDGPGAGAALLRHPVRWVSLRLKRRGSSR